MNEQDLSLDLLLQETMALTEYLRGNSRPDFAVAPEVCAEVEIESDLNTQESPPVEVQVLPTTPGLIYKIDNGASTFCIRGFPVSNISEAFSELSEPFSLKRSLLKLSADHSLESVSFFETRNFELAEVLKEQIINRRFPHQEDALCNLSDPGFSWWMNLEQESADRFEIFFRSHGINRADKYIQLGPIGDAAMAATRMNQARSLLHTSFPISEFSCDDKSFAVASLKPDHLSFNSFKNIFLEGVNNTEIENFPDSDLGRTLYYYFHELAVVRKFWIEVKTKLG